MRIERRSRTSTETNLERKSKQYRPAEESSFFSLLQAESVDNQNYTEVLGEIDEYAKEFLHSPTYENLRKYKEVVRRTLRQLIQESYTIDEQSFYDHRGRRRLLLLVQKVDQRLEDLTREFLHKQLNGLNLINRLDEIRGMIVDLYS